MRRLPHSANRARFFQAVAVGGDRGFSKSNETARCFLRFIATGNTRIQYASYFEKALLNPDWVELAKTMQPNYSLASPMRPRALLHATAICLLFAAGTVWAPPPGPIPQPPPKQKPPSTAKKAALPGSRGERGKSTFKTLEQPAALKQRAGPKQPLKQVAGPQLKLLQKIHPGLSATGVLVVEGSVKRFSTDFEAGAKHPDRFLSEVRLSQSTLVDDWLAAPQEKRIFVIGAGKDSAKVSELAKSLKSDGYEVFFYKFCRQSSGALCSSQAVGAMFGTSGSTMLYQTSFAKFSKYVTVEVATAGFLEGLNKRVVLISTSELLAAKFAMYVANRPTPTPSPVK
jgi:hypothetical protein